MQLGHRTNCLFGLTLPQEAWVSQLVQCKLKGNKTLKLQLGHRINCLFGLTLPQEAWVSQRWSVN